MKISVLPLMVITIVAALSIHGLRIYRGSMIIVIILKNGVILAVLTHLGINDPGTNLIEKRWTWIVGDEKDQKEKNNRVLSY